MLEGFKRWLSGSAIGTAGWEPVVAWAEAQRATFRGQQGEGFVIDGRTGAAAWRLEWGPSQRPYFAGGELRLRAEPGVDGELQLLVITRSLQEQLERAIFEQYVEDVQTRIDNQTPPEMRWLVMLPKLAGSEMPALREHFSALGNVKPWLQAWLRGGLTQQLARHGTSPVANGAAAAPPPTTPTPSAALAHPSAAESADGVEAARDTAGQGDTGARESAPGNQQGAGGTLPLVLMLGRGRLMLRCALDEPSVPALQSLLALFETALREARRAQEEVPLGGVQQADDSASPPSKPSGRSE